MNSKPVFRSPLRRNLEELERRDTPAFATLPPFTAGIVTPTVMATADFNGDGFTDAAIGNSLNSSNVPSIGIALGKGDGTFSAAPEITDALLNVPRSIVAADMNGDGHPDLVVGSAGPTSGAGSLQVFLGTGDGTFTGAVFTDPNPTIAVGIALFDSGIIPDIVAVNPDGPFVTGGYRIFAGDGTGAFSPLSAGSPYLTDGTRVASADFDNDGNQDFIALDSFSREMFTFFGDGTGNFTTPSPGFVALNAPPFDIVAGDFNDDGLQDVVISTNAGITLHPNIGGRQFDVVGSDLYTIATPTPFRLATAYLNFDGLPDILAVNPTQARVFLAGAGGKFTEDPTSPLSIPGNTQFADIAVGDVNGDGITDFLIVRRDSLTTSDGGVFLNLAPIPTFLNLFPSPNPAIEGQLVTLTATVAFTGNPFPFGVLPTGIVEFSSDGTMIGTGTITGNSATITSTFSVGRHELTARYFGDARFRPSFTFEPFLLDVNLAPGRTFQYEVTGLPTLPGLGADRVASGSITPDDISDIVLGAGPGRPAEVSIIDGKSRFEIATAMPFGLGFTGGLMLAAGDIDADGIDDVAVAADAGGGPRVSIYRNRDGRYLELTNNFFALDDAFRGGLRIALGDVDGDGKADLVVAGGPGAGPRVAVYDGRSLSEFQTPQRLVNDFFAMDPDLRLGMFVAAGDLDGDGKAEIAFSSDFGGGPQVVIFDGASLFSQPELTANFFAADPNARGGLRIAIRDISIDEGLELIVGDGPGDGSTVRVFTSGEVLLAPAPEPLISTELMPGFIGGVFVA